MNKFEKKYSLEIFIRVFRENKVSTNFQKISELAQRLLLHDPIEADE